MLKGIRGAAPVKDNTAEAVMAATTSLLQELVAANGFSPDHVVSAIFTLTPDLNAAFPAAAARALGWTNVPMLCAQEILVPGAMPQVVRVLIHAQVEGTVRHVYVGRAAALRPDWST